MCVCVCVFISMQITRPFCLVSCQTFGQGQSPRDWRGWGSVVKEKGGKSGEGERGERSEGTVVNCTGRRCERTYNGLGQHVRDRQKERL